MSEDIKRLFDEVEKDLEYFEKINNGGDNDRERLMNLRMKYLLLIALKNINTNLYEISHFGIGTD